MICKNCIYFKGFKITPYTAPELTGNGQIGDCIHPDFEIAEVRAGGSCPHGRDIDKGGDGENG